LAIVEIVYPTCCGIDVHKNFLVACVAKTDGHGHTNHFLKRFSTNTGDLRRLAQWLADLIREKSKPKLLDNF